MGPPQKTELAERVAKAAEAALARRGYASAVDVLLGIGWLDASHHERWRRGELTSLEEGIQTNAARVSQAVRLFAGWAVAHGLSPSEAVYVARTPTREALQFSARGDAEIERTYRTHWIPSGLERRKEERLKERGSRPPELVVIDSRRDWKCHRCGQSGDFLFMQQPGPACLPCAGLGGLEFLPAGDAALSRRAKASSGTFAVVVRWSRTRGRYERKGLLVEPAALESARKSLVAGRPRKARQE